MISEDRIVSFVRESNLIEGIHRDPTPDEIKATGRFFALEAPAVVDVELFVGTCQQGATLRRNLGQNVTVGDHTPPVGGPYIAACLNDILRDARNGGDPWVIHCRYEDLHPFMDGNGRSGRALWGWMMLRRPDGLRLAFLHQFYYQTLSHWRWRG